MPESEYFLCPACKAKLKFGRRPKARVTCPRCGHQFAYEATPKTLDPFAEDADAALREEEEEAEDPFAADFAKALKEVKEPRAPREVDFGDNIDAALTEDDDDYGRPLPLPARIAGSAASKQKSKPAPKRKKKRSKFRSDAVWLFVAAGVALALGLVVLLAIARPAFLFGPPLTPDDLAGLYASDDEPGLRIHFAADQSCEILELDQGRLPKLGRFAYTIKKNKITIELLKETKPQSETHLLERAIRAPQRFAYSEFANDLGDLTFRKGTLISSTKGSFTREQQPDEEEPDADAAAARPPATGARPIPEQRWTMGGMIRIAVSADGSTAVSGSPDGTVVVWDPKTGKPTAGWQTRFPAPALALSPDGSRLFVRARVLRLMDPHSGKYLQPDSDKLEWPTWLAHSFSSDGRFLFATSVGQVGQVLDGTTGKEQSRFEIYTGDLNFQKGIKTCVLFPDGGTCLAISLDYANFVQRGIVYHRILQWWNLESGRVDRWVELPEESLFGHDVVLALSGDGKTVAVGFSRNRNRDHVIQLRSASDGKVIGEIAPAGSWQHFVCLAFTKNDQTLTAVLLGAGDTPPQEERTGVWEWDVANHSKLRSSDQDSVWAAAEICPPANRVMCLTQAGDVSFFDLETFKPITP